VPIEPGPHPLREPGPHPLREPGPHPLREPASEARQIEGSQGVGKAGRREVEEKRGSSTVGKLPISIQEGIEEDAHGFQAASSSRAAKVSVAFRRCLYCDLSLHVNLPGSYQAASCQ
jgi:hypothetical protein